MPQHTDLGLIEETWDALQPYLDVDRCVDCECLQAALTELVMALEGQRAEPGKLLTAIRQAMDLSQLHGCLGCEPCEPADILVSFYRARDAVAAGEGCSCVPCRADESSAS